MGMTIDTIIKDCEQRIKQNELFIKVHQANMEIGEVKEYQYYIERDKLTADTLRKYQKIEEIYKNWCCPTYFNATDAMNKLGEVLKDGNDTTNTGSN